MTKTRAQVNLREETLLMIVTTAIDIQPVTEYVTVVTGEAVLGTNVFRDLFGRL